MTPLSWRQDLPPWGQRSGSPFRPRTWTFPPGARGPGCLSRPPPGCRVFVEVGWGQSIPNVESQFHQNPTQLG
eukprot:1878812-Heterocapsa_arctica.AAC.1